jgi:hypothetical protein
MFVAACGEARLFFLGMAMFALAPLPRAGRPAIPDEALWGADARQGAGQSAPTTSLAANSRGGVAY